MHFSSFLSLRVPRPLTSSGLPLEVRSAFWKFTRPSTGRPRANGETSKYQPRRPRSREDALSCLALRHTRHLKQYGRLNSCYRARLTLLSTVAAQAEAQVHLLVVLHGRVHSLLSRTSADHLGHLQALGQPLSRRQHLQLRSRARQRLHRSPISTALQLSLARIGRHRARGTGRWDERVGADVRWDRSLCRARRAGD